MSGLMHTTPPEHPCPLCGAYSPRVVGETPTTRMWATMPIMGMYAVWVPAVSGAAATPLHHVRRRGVRPVPRVRPALSRTVGVIPRRIYRYRRFKLFVVRCWVTKSERSRKSCASSRSSGVASADCVISIATRRAASSS